MSGTDSIRQRSTPQQTSFIPPGSMEQEETTPKFSARWGQAIYRYLFKRKTVEEQQPPSNNWIAKLLLNEQLFCRLLTVVVMVVMVILIVIPYVRYYNDIQGSVPSIIENSLPNQLRIEDLRLLTRRWLILKPNTTDHELFEYKDWFNRQLDPQNEIAEDSLYTKVYLYQSEKFSTGSRKNITFNTAERFLLEYPRSNTQPCLALSHFGLSYNLILIGDNTFIYSPTIETTSNVRNLLNANYPASVLLSYYRNRDVRSGKIRETFKKADAVCIISALLKDV